MYVSDLFPNLFPFSRNKNNENWTVEIKITDIRRIDIQSYREFNRTDYNRIHYKDLIEYHPNEVFVFIFMFMRC